MAFDQDIHKIREEDCKLLVLYEAENGDRTIVAGHDEEGVILHDVLNAQSDFPDWIFNDS